MKICVYGTWHLGSVTAACLADAGFNTTGLDDQTPIINNLSNGIPPIFEPGLAELVKSGLEKEKLHFTTDLRAAVGDANLVWVTFDTPVDDQDRADIDFVKNRIESIFPYLRDKSVVLVSSQMPVKSVNEMQTRFDKIANGRVVSFACSPENLRLGKAISVFTNPGRIVVGIKNNQPRSILEPILSKFCSNIIWMSIESAEMVKHALNTFLALCVTFSNEIATVCEQVGANASDVEKGLRTDPRVGEKAYVRAGSAFAGGTLARDVKFLQELSAKKNIDISLISNIEPSNSNHRKWPMRQLKQRLGTLEGKRIGILGLSYKPGTDVTRRSIAIELCRWVSQHGAKVVAFDPKVKRVESDLQDIITLAPTAEKAAEEVDALVIATEWPEFKELSPNKIVGKMRTPIIIDQNKFLNPDFSTDKRVNFATIGVPT